ncbi:MAG: 2-hydroxyacyl-CoA dehydratase family protein [Polyangiales bacterium]
MSNHVPVELIHAAGCFPLQLPTGPLPATPHADRYLGSVAHPQVKSALERLVRGDFGCVDLLVLPRVDEELERLHHAVRTLRCAHGMPLPEPFLYDVAYAPWGASTEHSHASLLALKCRLEALAGRPTDDATLRASIRVYNEVRGRLGRLVARRRERACRLDGCTAVEVFTAVQRLRPEAACEALDRMLTVTGDVAPGTRTLLIGSAHDTPALHRMIARAGGQVVGDHHWRGELLLGPAIDERLPPLRALCSHYHGRAESSRTFPSNNEALVTFAKQVGAEAAVFFYYPADGAHTWDYAAQSEALSASGIPSIALEQQGYPPVGEVEDTLRRFFEALR